MHDTTADFWKEYRALPADIRERADKQFALLKANPRHPSLQFKKLTERRGQEIWSRPRHAANIALSPRRTITIMSGSGSANTTYTTTLFDPLPVSQNRSSKRHESNTTRRTN
jgi:hypothetical protein